ncbi:anti-sigma factor domain-containing protein [Pseudarthrobacter sp. NamE5]|uniref:anti-sigma factor domain-containing protein n=1 Tax=Pseudarthrobacter sp. NamE5 TaxID=2576839 RepID=UPI00352A7341
MLRRCCWRGNAASRLRRPSRTAGRTPGAAGDAGQGGGSPGRVRASGQFGIARSSGCGSRGGKLRSPWLRLCDSRDSCHSGAACHPAAAGSARVVEAADGSRSLEVRLSQDEVQGYQEVWLIAPDLSRLVSLGVVNSETETFELPAGLQLPEYPIVDVSDEPIDGNPAHSSVSIARGTFNT